MWTFLQTKDLTESPITYFERVLPRQREAYHQHHIRAQKLLADSAFDKRLTFFATDDRGPVGIALVTGSDTDKRQIDLVGVRGDRRRRGLGRALLEHVIQAGRKGRVQTLIASGVSSANTPAVRLLDSLGFEGRGTGGVRMRYSLEDPVAACQVAEGFTLRALQPGEEEAWVDLKNRCFREEGGRDWTVENFQRGFINDPVFDYSRIFVVTQNDYLVATSTAWEADYGEGPIGLIHWVGTDPEYRGNGLGYALTVRTMEELAALGYPEAWLNTGLRRGPAVRLYERLGFYIHRETYTYTLLLT
jgi:mycothiol synthase